MNAHEIYELVLWLFVVLPIPAGLVIGLAVAGFVKFLLREDPESAVPFFVPLPEQCKAGLEAKVLEPPSIKVPTLHFVSKLGSRRLAESAWLESCYSTWNSLLSMPLSLVKD